MPPQSFEIGPALDEESAPDQLPLEQNRPDVECHDTKSQTTSPSVPPISYWGEWMAQLKTAWPSMCGMLLYKFPWLISLRFVGGIGGQELAAAALASTLCNVTGLSLSVGLSSALTTLAGQARGHLLRKRQLRQQAEAVAWEKEYSFDETTTTGDTSEGALEGDEELEDVSLLRSNHDGSTARESKNKPLMPVVFLVRGMFVQLALVIPVGIWWLFGIESVLIRLGQGALLSQMTQEYLRILTPGLWGYSVNMTLNVWLYSMEMADIPAYAAACGLLAHVPLNYLFIYVFDWGYLGCAAATVAFQVLQPIGIICYLQTARAQARLWQQMGAPTVPSRSSVWPTLKLAVSKGVGQYLALALPGVISISEWWASETAILLSGRFDKAVVALGAMTLYQSINSSCFMFPVSFSIAGATRVSTWLGAGESHAAAKASALSVASAGCLSGLIGFTLYATPHTFFPSLFAPTETELYNQAGQLMPLLALYVFADGIQVALNGTIKGCGRQVWTIPVVIIAYWVVGLPLAYYWAFDENCTTLCGDMGLVSGMTTATWVHMIMLAVLVICGTDWAKEAQKAHARMVASEGQDETE